MAKNKKKEKEVLPPLLLSPEVEVCASFLARFRSRFFVLVLVLVLFFCYCFRFHSSAEHYKET